MAKQIKKPRGRKEREPKKEDRYQVVKVCVEDAAAILRQFPTMKLHSVIGCGRGNEVWLFLEKEGDNGKEARLV